MEHDETGRFLCPVCRTKFINEGIERVTSDIQYLTIFRKRLSNYLILAEKIEHTLVTKDGVIVDSKDFFEQFDLDDD